MKEKETIIDKLNRVITMAGTAVMMNLLFLVSCLPIVTIGQAWCALMSAIRYQIRGDSWFQGFKFGFKTRFWRGTVAWCILLVVDVLMLLDVMQYTAMEQVSIVHIIASCIMFALMAMLTLSFLVLNVYIPTSISNWIRNACSLVFKAPLQMLCCALLMWAPVLLFIFWIDLAYFVAITFVVVYYLLAALGTTLLLKEVLVEFLLEARAEGTLIAEEGKLPDPEEDEE